MMTVHFELSNLLIVPAKYWFSISISKLHRSVVVQNRTMAVPRAKRVVFRGYPQAQPDIWRLRPPQIQGSETPATSHFRPEPARFPNDHGYPREETPMSAIGVMIGFWIVVNVALVVGLLTAGRDRSREDASAMEEGPQKGSRG